MIVCAQCLTGGTAFSGLRIKNATIPTWKIAAYRLSRAYQEAIKIFEYIHHNEKLKQVNSG